MTSRLPSKLKSCPKKCLIVRTNFLKVPTVAQLVARGGVIPTVKRLVKKRRKITKRLPNDVGNHPIANLVEDVRIGALLTEYKEGQANVRLKLGRTDYDLAFGWMAGRAWRSELNKAK